jgi:hypothetical protein
MKYKLNDIFREGMDAGAFLMLFSCVFWDNIIHFISINDFRFLIMPVLSIIGFVWVFRKYLIKLRKYELISTEE